MPLPMEVPADPRRRAEAFLDAYFMASDDADIEIRLGRAATGEPAVGVSIGKDMHAFTAREARIVADSAESALHALPKEREAATLPNLILALRMGADKAEQQAMSEKQK